MKNNIIDVGLVVGGLVFIIFHERLARWFYEKTQRSSHTLVSSFVSEEKYERVFIVVNRCGFIFWGGVLMLVGFINFFGLVL